MSTGKINASLVAILRGLKAITKDRRNESQGFKFRGIDDIYNDLHALFAEHGVVTAPEVVADRTEERKSRNDNTIIYRILTVKYHFIAEDGSELVVGPIMGEGMDSGDKASNKALAIAHKYAITQLFTIPTDEVKDPDASTPPETTRKELSKTSAPVTNPVAGGHAEIVTVGITDIKTKSGTSAKGPWTRFYFKAADGQFYSTFDTKLADMLREATGSELELRIQRTDKGNNVLAIQSDSQEDPANELPME